MPGSPTPVQRPAFVLGVTGHMDFEQLSPAQQKAVRDAVLKVFRYVLKEDVIPELGPGLGLKRANVILLSSFAPGADTVVADMARDEEIGIRARAPLPFPPGQYVKATTFEGLSAGKREALHKQLTEMEAKGDAFHVLLLEDMERSPEKLKAKLEEDLADKDRSDLRYRAAGEHIARHCHLLIALTPKDYSKEDYRKETQKPEELLPPPGDPVPAGADVVVFAKRQGLTRKLLAAAPALNWADTGPVFHVYTPKPDQGQDQDPANPPAVGTLTRLYTFDAYSEENPKWQQDMRHQFWQMVQRMKDFQEVPEANEEEQEFSELLKGIQPEKLRKKKPEYFDGLDGLARVFRRADRTAVRFHTGARIVLGCLFWLTLTAALLVHLAAHWHTAAGHGGGSPDAGDTEPPKAAHGHSAEDQEEGVARWRVWLVRLALAAFLIAVVVFWITKRRLLDETQYDYRALAEGLRVQFYWGAAGLGQSVPANYMQRQRNEMEWIRKAIGSLAAPYSRFRTWFQALGKRQRLDLLRAVTKDWVVGQLHYYRRRWKEDNHTEHFWHQFGLCWAIAGVLHAGVLSLWLWPPHERTLKELSSTWTNLLGLAGVVLLVAWFVAWVLAVRKKNSERPGRLRAIALGFREPWKALFHRGQSLELWCRRLLPVSKWVGDKAARKGRIGGYLLTALLITAASLGLTVGVFGRTGLLPTAQACWTITLGSCLVIGALAVAWAEKNLVAEQARQYSAMAALFHAARRRINSNLKAARTALKGGDLPTFEKRLRVVQNLLFQLGLQALDEHAEWLMLHRARPLEPVMAG